MELIEIIRRRDALQDEIADKLKQFVNDCGVDIESVDWHTQKVVMMDGTVKSLSGRFEIDARLPPIN